MIRDQYGIIVQPDLDDQGKIIPGKWDEGDSAFSTGLSAFGGSEQDFKLMYLFIKDGKLVRHPYSTKNTGTAPHNDPAATSRDQVLAFFSGILGRDFSNITDSQERLQYTIVRQACLNYANSWTVNKDILSPANKLYLFKCAGAQAPAWLVPLATTNQILDLGWNCFIKPDHEMNQSAVINCAFGDIWIKALYYGHPNLYKNLDEYFNGWRNRAEIAAGMENRITKIVFK